MLKKCLQKSGLPEIPAVFFVIKIEWESRILNLLKLLPRKRVRTPAPVRFVTRAYIILKQDQIILTCYRTTSIFLQKFLKINHPLR